MSQQYPPQDARIWAGRIDPGRRAEHEQFVGWLNSDEAHEIFRRRRLTTYQLREAGDRVTVLFTAPKTGDPRIMIDFLRYPGLWPHYWTFERGGRPDEHEDSGDAGATRVAWQAGEA